MTDRRQRHITVKPDGRLVDDDTMARYLAGLERKRVTVERLSRQDPAIVAFEATQRGARAA